MVQGHSCLFSSNSIIKSVLFRLDHPVRMRRPRCTSQNADFSIATGTSNGICNDALTLSISNWLFYSESGASFYRSAILSVAFYSPFKTIQVARLGYALVLVCVLSELNHFWMTVFVKHLRNVNKKSFGSRCFIKSQRILSCLFFGGIKSLWEYWISAWLQPSYVDRFWYTNIFDHVSLWCTSSIKTQVYKKDFEFRVILSGKAVCFCDFHRDCIS